MSYKNFMRTYPQFERYFTEWQVTAYLLCVTLSRMSIAGRNKADGRKIMKILHIGREENMERYPAPDYLAQEIETVSLPMGKRPEDYLDAMEGAQVIVADAMADVPGALIRKMPYLKMIHSEGVAYNRIDLKTAKEREIYVCNCRGMNASAVAEQTVFLMQGMLKNVLLNDRGVREGRQIQIKE